jgi:hypothetical protein
MSDNIDRYRKYVELLEKDELIIGPIIEVRGLLDDNSEVHELDRQLITLAGSLVMIKGSWGDWAGEPEWWCNLWPIARGEYPIEKLPVYLRKLAHKLYYGG